MSVNHKEAAVGLRSNIQATYTKAKYSTPDIIRSRYNAF